MSSPSDELSEWLPCTPAGKCAACHCAPSPPGISNSFSTSWTGASSMPAKAGIPRLSCTASSVRTVGACIPERRPFSGHPCSYYAKVWFRRACRIFVPSGTFTAVASFAKCGRCAAVIALRLKGIFVRGLDRQLLRFLELSRLATRVATVFLFVFSVCAGLFMHIRVRLTCFTRFFFLSSLRLVLKPVWTGFSVEPFFKIPAALAAPSGEVLPAG